ncbi:hypothetical protein [Flavobacterium phage FL-1]|nr:hypothetical protein [Flavobacterium phage FL-1]
MYEVTEKSTVHGVNTPHGFKTPHRFPISGIKNVADIMADLAAQLYPTGRAFFTKKGSIKDNFHLAVNRSFIRIINDSQSTIDSCFPDNVNFTQDDCALWEYRFGIITNILVPIEDRKNAIFRRMGRGRNVLARQHRSYIEYQLQTAGFDVYVYENGFIEGGIKVYKTPQEILASDPGTVQHGGNTQHGLGTQHGGSSAQIIANSYQPNELFSVSDEDLWATFFIGGATLGSVANIPGNREEELRELVLKLKPAHLIAFTFINYV